jgi:tetratricopeptide (TPR) repeat protein
MNDRWQEGLEHFRRGNFYAARDIWESAAADELCDEDACKIANGLGAVYVRLIGPTAAKSHMEQAYALTQRGRVQHGTKMKVISNMGVLLCQLGHVKDGLKFCRKAFSMLDSNYPHESFTTLIGYVYALACAEAHHEVLKLRAKFDELIDQVNDEQVRMTFSPSFYLNMAYSAERTGHQRLAYQYCVDSCCGLDTSPNIVFVAGSLLRQQRYEEALKYVSPVLEVVFNDTRQNELRILAHSLEFFGRIADHAGQVSLAKRCIEKAEMYFGQMGMWNEWLEMRGFQFGSGNTVPSDDIKPSLRMPYQAVSHFLDDLTLIDGMMFMFPDMYRLSQFATDLAVRIFRRVSPEHHTLERCMHVAGRLVYLGLNTVAERESEAKQALQDEAKLREVVHLTLRLLEAYPHTKTYMALIGGLESGGHEPCQDEIALASRCLKISFEYLNKIEIYRMSHEEAIQEMKHQSEKTGVDEPFAEFVREMTLTQEEVVG